MTPAPTAIALSVRVIVPLLELPAVGIALTKVVDAIPAPQID